MVVNVVTNVTEQTNTELNATNNNTASFIANSGCTINVGGNLDTSTVTSQALTLAQYGTTASTTDIDTAVTQQLMQQATSTLSGLAIGFAGSYTASTATATISSGVTKITTQTLDASNNNSTKMTCSTGATINVAGDWTDVSTTSQSLVATQVGSNQTTTGVSSSVEQAVSQSASSSVVGLNLNFGFIIIIVALGLVLLLLGKPLSMLLGMTTGFGNMSVAGTALGVGLLGVLFIVASTLSRSFRQPCNAHAQCQTTDNPTATCSCTDQYACGTSGTISQKSIGVTSPPLMWLYSVYEGNSGLFTTSIRRMAVRAFAGSDSTNERMNNSGYSVGIYLDMMDYLLTQNSNEGGRMSRALLRFFARKAAIAATEPDGLLSTVDMTMPAGWNGFSSGKCMEAAAEALMPIRPFHLSATDASIKTATVTTAPVSATLSTARARAITGTGGNVRRTGYQRGRLTETAATTMDSGAPNLIRPMCYKVSSDGSSVAFTELSSYADAANACSKLGMDSMWMLPAASQNKYATSSRNKASIPNSNDGTNLTTVIKPLGSEMFDSKTLGTCVVKNSSYNAGQSSSQSYLWGISNTQCAQFNGSGTGGCATDDSTNCASKWSTCGTNDHIVANAGAAAGMTVGYTKTDNKTYSTAVCQQVGSDTSTTNVVFAAHVPDGYKFSLDTKESPSVGLAARSVGYNTGDSFCREALGFHQVPSGNGTDALPSRPYMSKVTVAIDNYLSLTASMDGATVTLPFTPAQLGNYGNEPVGNCSYQFENYLPAGRQRVCGGENELKNCWTQQLCEGHGGAWTTAGTVGQTTQYKCVDSATTCAADCTYCSASECTGTDKCALSGTSCITACAPATNNCAGCGASLCTTPCAKSTWGSAQQYGSCGMPEDACQCYTDADGNAATSTTNALTFNFRLVEMPSNFRVTVDDLSTTAPGCLPQVFVPDPSSATNFTWNNTLCQATAACCPAGTNCDGLGLVACPPATAAGSATTTGSLSSTNFTANCSNSTCYADTTATGWRVLEIPDKKTPLCFFRTTANRNTSDVYKYLAVYNPEQALWRDAQQVNSVRLTMWYTLNRMLCTCLLYSNHRASDFAMLGFSTFMNPGGMAVDGSGTPRYALTATGLASLEEINNNSLHVDYNAYVWYAAQPLIVMENGEYEAYTLREIYIAQKWPLLAQLNTFVYEPLDYQVNPEAIAEVGLSAVDPAKFADAATDDTAAAGFAALADYSGTIFGGFGECRTWWSSDAWINGTLAGGIGLLAGVAIFGSVYLALKLKG